MIGGSWAELLPSNSYQIQIPQGATQQVLVRITVPPSAPAGLADMATVQASSNFDPSVTAVVTDTVIARPTVGTRYVSLNGSDQDNNCTQTNTPCQTIGHAVGQASFNDEVRIAVGSAGGNAYNESSIPLNDTIHISGGWTSNYTTQQDPDQTVIDGGGSSLIFDIAPGAAIQPTISNLTIQGGNNAGPGGAI